MRFARQRDRPGTDHLEGRPPEAAGRMEGLDLLDEQAIAARPAVFGEIFTHNAVDINDPARVFDTGGSSREIGS